MNKFIKISEGKVYNVETVSDCIKVITENEYWNCEESMSEVLASVEINGFSAEEVVDIYAKCVWFADRDLMVRFYDETNETGVKTLTEDYMILGRIQ